MIFIGKGVSHFKKEQKLKWWEIKERLEYKSLACAQNLAQKRNANTSHVTRLAKCFGVSEIQFLEACIVKNLYSWSVEIDGKKIHGFNTFDDSSIESLTEDFNKKKLALIEKHKSSEETEYPLTVIAFNKVSE